MKEYLMNLCRALLGHDPYRERLDDLQEKYQKAGENVASLREMYLAACEKWGDADKQAKTLQQLVENLRERVREKDVLMERMKQDYQQRIKVTPSLSTK